MPVVWEQSGDAFFATAETTRNGERYYLVIDQLPRGGWDWSVWRQGDSWRLARNGTADTAQEAMKRAEEAV